MKNTKILLAAAIVSASILSIGSINTYADTMENNFNTENKSVVEAKRVTISLYGNASTGYNWDYTFTDPSVAEVENTKYISDDPTGTLCGSGGTEIWSVKGLKEGTTEVIFNYKRKWEDESEKVRVYEINVDSDLNVTVTEKTSRIARMPFFKQSKGYEWKCRVKDDSIVRANDFVADSDEDQVVHSWSFYGLNKGNTTLTFEYVPLGGGEALKTEYYSVIVDAQRNVAVKKKGQTLPKEGNISFYANTDKGYKRMYHIEDPSIAELGEENFTRHNDIAKSNWSVKGLKEGETRITFSDISPDGKVQFSISYIVSVDSDLSVKVKQAGLMNDWVTKDYDIPYLGEAPRGYKWEYKVKDESIAEMGEEKYKYTVPGTSGLLVKGLKEGVTEVTFNQVSETGDIAKTITYVINVDSNLNAKVTKKKDVEPKKGSISLHGNMSTGYEWEYEVKDDSIAKINEEACLLDHPEIEECDGRGQTQIWSVEGLKEGTTEVTFNYRRPWEDEKPDKTITYTITVDSDLNVTVTENKEVQPETSKISIDCCPSTGYVWRPELKNPSIAEIGKGEVVYEGECCPGASGTEVWPVKGLKEGTTEAVFAEFSPAEKVENLKVYTISVDKDLNVTVTEKKKINVEKEAISLHGNMSTGYEWQYEIKDKAIAEIEEKVCISDAQGNPEAMNDVGVGQTQIWSVEGLKEGTTEVTFSYSRPWEEVEPDETITYVITVDSDLHATVKEKKNTVPSDKGDLVLNVEENDAESSNQINPVISLENKSDKDIDLSKVTLKYYYTADEDKDEVFQCYYSGTTGGEEYTNFTSYVDGNIKKIDPDERYKNADRCLEIRFSDGILRANQSMTVNACVHREDWSSYDRTNDYSFKNEIGTEFIYK